MIGYKFFQDKQGEAVVCERGDGMKRERRGVL